MKTARVHDQPAILTAPLPASGPAALGLSFSFVLVLVAAAVLIPGIQVSLFDRDEGWYAQVSREMLTTGDWLTPRYLGEVWIAKPPLLYWLVAASFRLLGVGEWQARLVSVLTGCITVLLTGTLGARLFDRRTGLIAGLLLATTGLFAGVSRLLLTDGPMLACTLGAILVHWGMRDRPRLGAAWAYGCLIGLGLLAKGPATLLFAGVFGLGLLAGGWRRWVWSGRYWLWLPVALLVATPWYIHIASVARSVLVEQFLGFEIVSRITGAPRSHLGPPGYHLVQSLTGLLPWTVFAPGVVWTAWKDRRQPRNRLLLVWCGTAWVTLELIPSKLPHYILPCYVPLMLLLARQMSAVWQQPGLLSSASGAERAVLRLWPRIMIGVGVVLVIAGFLVEFKAAGLRLSLAGGVLIAGFYFVARGLSYRSAASGFATAIVMTVLFYVFMGLVVMPSLEPLRLSRKVARVADELATNGTPILLCGYNEPSVYFYLDSRAGAIAPADLPDRLSTIDRPLVLALTGQARAALSPQAAERLAGWQPRRINGFNYAKMEKVTLEIGVFAPPPAARVTHEE